MIETRTARLARRPGELGIMIMQIRQNAHTECSKILLVDGAYKSVVQFGAYPTNVGCGGVV